MKYCFLFFISLIFSFTSFCQTDSTLSIHIIGDKVCIDRNKLQLNFSYYYENHTAEPIVVIDYSEPCFWETHLLTDSSKSPFIYLVIQDDLGNTILPNVMPDSTYIPYNQKKNLDSTTFHTDYFHEKETLSSENTLTVAPKAEFVSLFSMKLNRRKCFNPKLFVFDFSRKYTFQVVYSAKEDIRELASDAFVKNHGKYFQGKIVSNKVALCFK